MIKLERPTRNPKALSRRRTRRLYENCRQAIQARRKICFDRLWLDEEVREELWKCQHRKCCYCERMRELKRESDVEHFRPKGAIRGEGVPQGYWWLAYEWSNLLYSCKPCNETYKREQFPLLAGGIRARQPGDDLERERPVLIDPYVFNPSDFITFVWEHSEGRYVKAVGLDHQGRGERTINILGLNRSELMEERAQYIMTLHGIVTMINAGEHFAKEALVKKGIRRMKAEISPDRPFLGFRLAYFRAAGMTEYL